MHLMDISYTLTAWLYSSSLVLRFHLLCTLYGWLYMTSIYFDQYPNWQTHVCKSIGAGIIHILHKENYIATFFPSVQTATMQNVFNLWICNICMVNCRNVYLHTDRITDTAHALDFYVGLTQARQSLIHNYYRDACCPGIGWNWSKWMTCRPAFQLGGGHSSNQPSARGRWP